MNDQISSNEIKYKHQNPLQQYLIQKFMKTILEMVISLNVRNILDVGCGEGFLSSSLLEINSQFNITGIEISIYSIRRGLKMNPGLRISNASVYNIPVKSQIVDLVLCTELLEHLSHPEDAINEIKRVSKRYCLFSVPNEPFFRMANFLRGKNVSRLGNDIDHVQHWGANAFINYLLKNNLEVIQTGNEFPWTIVLTSVKPS
jgi:2-polyprenyl-3-methyl-5-hydroxy-6-metoxy-1,4-benzoquinol methylase